MIINFKIKVLKVKKQVITKEWDEKLEYRLANVKLAELLKKTMIKFFKKQGLDVDINIEVVNG